MKVLVSDTSVLIDLERGALLGTSFALPFEFALPDLLYRQELAEHGGLALLKRGLRIEGLDGVLLHLSAGSPQIDSAMTSFEPSHCPRILGDSRPY